MATSRYEYRRTSAPQVLAESAAPVASVSDLDVDLTPYEDGGIITIQMLVGVVGLGDAGDIVTVAESPLIDLVLARNWAMVYLGPNPPPLPLIVLDTGVQELTSGQQLQVRTNLALDGVYVAQDDIPLNPTINAQGLVSISVNSRYGINSLGLPYVADTGFAADGEQAQATIVSGFLNLTKIAS